jgi:hypothetical protein
VRDPEGEQRSERGGSHACLGTDDAAHVALVDEPDIACKAAEVVLAGSEALERLARAQANAVPGDGLTRLRAEDAAEVVRRDRKRAPRSGSDIPGCVTSASRTP